MKKTEIQNEEIRKNRKNHSSLIFEVIFRTYQKTGMPLGRALLPHAQITLDIAKCIHHETQNYFPTVSQVKNNPLGTTKEMNIFKITVIQTENIQMHFVCEKNFREKSFRLSLGKSLELFLG